MNVPFYNTLQQCDKVIVENTTMPYMTSFHSCLNRMMGDGYTDTFRPTVKGLQSKRTERIYRPQEIMIVNSLRFEGNANPEDNATMYMIETVDGLKGTLVHKYGTFGDNLMEHLFKPEKEVFNANIQVV
ncbi:MAG: hypothetical protein WKF97_16690 [Chitinophagaceae bacterium]